MLREYKKFHDEPHITGIKGINMAKNKEISPFRNPVSPALKGISAGD
jgi:hypothetical protein